MDKRKIVRYLLITLSVILGVLVFLSITGTVAHAAGLVDNTVSDANAYSKYPLENYQLDFYVDSSWDWLPWNWLDGIGKSIQYGLYAITNFVWTVSLYISNATGYVVQEAYKLDFISDTANSIGKNIQTLAGVTSSGFSSEGFYVGFLLILILVMGIYVAYTGNAPNPKSILTISAEDAWKHFCNDFDTNAILKPSRNSGSRGIAKVVKTITKEDFMKLYEVALNESRDSSVLIEQFIEGPEFSVEIIVWEGKINVLQVTDKKTTEAPHFVELGHNQPSCFSDNVVAIVKDAAIRGVQPWTNFSF